MKINRCVEKLLFSFFLSFFISGICLADSFLFLRSGDIYSYSFQNKLEEKIVDITTSISYLRISPDETKIAYITGENPNYYIYICDIDGNSSYKLTDTTVTGYTNFGRGLSWSPDGTQLLFNHNSILYRINSDGSNLTNIATAPTSRSFLFIDWSSTGDKIVTQTMGSWGYANEIYIMDSDGSNMTKLVDDLPGGMYGATISPDGQKIAYAYDVTENEEYWGKHKKDSIFVMNIDGSELTNISIHNTEESNDRIPIWSTDGKKILFHSNVYETGSDIWIMNIDGTNREKVIEGAKYGDWKQSNNCDIEDSDNDGVPNQWDVCPETELNAYVDKTGCPPSGLYTEEQLNQIISHILAWGDLNGDNKIGLSEAVRALKISSGVTEPSIKFEK